MDYKNIMTTCVYCGAGCGLFLQVLDGKITGVLPAKEHPISQGKLCIKGWNVASFVNHSDRIKTPLIKKGTEFKAASWDEALQLIAKKLGDIYTKYGSESLGFLASAKCTNEENYLLQKFARSIFKTNNIDHCARL